MPHSSVPCRERQLRCGSQHETEPGRASWGGLRYQLLPTCLSSFPPPSTRSRGRTGHSPAVPGSACSRDSVPLSEQRCAQEEIGFAQVLLPFQWHSLAHARRRSWGAMCSSSRRGARLRTTYQSRFSEIPLPQVDPCRPTALKIRPSVTCAAAVHFSTAPFTQFGSGTVRTCPPLPTRSTLAQCPWRICTSSIFRDANSARCKPQPNRIAIIARSRLLRRVSPSDFSRRRWHCSRFSQFPDL
jgi:hypothetical protein